MADECEIKQRRSSRYMGFTSDAEPKDIQKAFRRRHGVPPAEVFLSGPVILAGPIPTQPTE